VALDTTVAFAGAVAIALAMLLLALAFVPVARVHAGRAVRVSRFATSGPSPMSAIGLALALRTDRGRGRIWRAGGATLIATTMFAVTVAFVVSAVALTNDRTRYGLTGDLVVVNQFGNQSEADLMRAFGGDNVEAAAAYTTTPLRISRHAVPGIAVTPVKGELHPTMLSGRAPSAPDEIALGQETLRGLDARLGGAVSVELSELTSAGREVPRDPLSMRIVGVATFPSVRQSGVDMPRLGNGALITRDAFRRLHGDPRNTPEFTVVRVADGSSTQSVKARTPNGFVDADRTATEWFTDAKPAELLHLDLAMRYLRGAVVVGFLILLAVVMHALWSLVRANTRDLAVLRAMGATPRQTDRIVASQAVPVSALALLVALPIGVAAGRWAFVVFADSLAVVDDATSSPLALLLLIGGTLISLAAGVVTSMLTARRGRTAALLRAP
jgi:ABC-type lipoprotein release transport system permease subunit